jgi:TatD family-associated radical SAM protein
MHSPPTIVYPANGNLYLNLTNRCSCDCTFCLRRFTWEVYGYDLRLDAEPGIPEILDAVDDGLDETRPDQLVFCGLGEPTLRLDAVLAVTSVATERGVQTRLDTNGCGQLSNPETDVVRSLADAGLDAVSISLNAADPAEYISLCKPGHRDAHGAVVRFAEQCLAAGIDTTMTALDGLGVDLEACRAVAEDLGASFRARGCARPRPAHLRAPRPTPTGRPAGDTVRRFGVRSSRRHAPEPRHAAGSSGREAR